MKTEREWWEDAVMAGLGVVAAIVAMILMF